MARHPLRAFDRHWVRPIELLEQVSFSTVTTSRYATGGRANKQDQSFVLSIHCPHRTLILNLLSQATSYKGTFELGYLLQTHPQTIILLVNRITAERPRGLSKATPSKNGNRQARFSGFTAIVSISHPFLPFYG